MSNWTKYEPFGGWAAFNETEALTKELWQLLPAEKWHYFDITAGSSIWESRASGSSVVVHYDESNHMVEFQAEDGLAVETMAPLATRFHLTPHVA